MGAEKRMRIIHAKDTITIALCFMVIHLAIGCAATKRIGQDITSGGKGLKKKIALVPTVNKTGYGGKEFENSARAHLKTGLESVCDDLVIMDSQEGRSLLGQIPRLPSGELNNLALTKLGRALGLNAVVEETLFEIECVEDRRGIWGFRNTCMLVQLHMRVKGHDIETGAILFDEVVNDEVEVSQDDWQDINERSRYHEEIGDQLIAKATNRICGKLCETLSSEPWKGYVTSVSSNTFALAAGKDVGLAIGDVLDVFGTSEPIEGQGGQFYLVSGLKIGELRITAVHRNRAEAIALLGSDLQKSSHVRLKRKPHDSTNLISNNRPDTSQRKDDLGLAQEQLDGAVVLPVRSYQ